MKIIIDLRPEIYVRRTDYRIPLALKDAEEICTAVFNGKPVNDNDISEVN